MKTNIQYLTVSIIFLFISCKNTPQEDQIKASINHEMLVESTCRFSKAEIKKFYHRTRKKEQFKDSEYLGVLSRVISHLGNSCDIHNAKIEFLTYLRSPKFKEESKSWMLKNDFVDQRMKWFNTDQSELNVLKQMAIAIAQITHHEADARSRGMYSRMLSQRLSEVHGDTIELRKNKLYVFPTTYYYNNISPAEVAVNHHFITVHGGSEVGIIRKEELKAGSTRGPATITTNAMIHVKTVD